MNTFQWMAILGFLSPVFASAQIGLSLSEWEQKFGDPDGFGYYYARGYGLSVKLKDGKVAWIEIEKGNTAFSKSEYVGLVKSLCNPTDHVVSPFRPFMMRFTIAATPEMAREVAAAAEEARRARDQRPAVFRLRVSQVLTAEDGEALLGYPSKIRNGLIEPESEHQVIVFGGDAGAVIDGAMLKVSAYPAGRFKFETVLGAQVTIAAFHMDAATALKRLDSGTD